MPSLLRGVPQRTRKVSKSTSFFFFPRRAPHAFWSWSSVRTSVGVLNVGIISPGAAKSAKNAAKMVLVVSRPVTCSALLGPKLYGLRIGCCPKDTFCYGKGCCKKNTYGCEGKSCCEYGESCCSGGGCCKPGYVSKHSHPPRMVF